MSHSSIEQKIHDYRSNNTDGSMKLLLQALNIIYEWTDNTFKNTVIFVEELYKLINNLIDCHPSMHIIKNSLLLFKRETRDLQSTEDNVESTKSRIQNLVNDFKKRQSTAISSIAICFGNIIGENLNLLTISYSSTVLNAVLYNKHKISKVFVLESRPINEGLKLIKQLSENEINTHLLYDMQCGYYLDEVDIVLIGSDAVYSNGDVINKMGSKVLAIISYHNNIPFYVLTQTNKIMNTDDSKIRKNFKKHSKSEITAEKLSSVIIENIYFDITPSHLITSYITEDGKYNQRDVRSKSIYYTEKYKSL